MIVDDDTARVQLKDELVVDFAAVPGVDVDDKEEKEKQGQEQGDVNLAELFGVRDVVPMRSRLVSFIHQLLSSILKKTFLEP